MACTYPRSSRGSSTNSRTSHQSDKNFLAQALCFKESISGEDLVIQLCSNHFNSLNMKESDVDRILHLTNGQHPFPFLLHLHLSNITRIKESGVGSRPQNQKLHEPFQLHEYDKE